MREKTNRKSLIRRKRNVEQELPIWEKRIRPVFLGIIKAKGFVQTVFGGKKLGQFSGGRSYGDWDENSSCIQEVLAIYRCNKIIVCAYYAQLCGIKATVEITRYGNILKRPIIGKS